MSSFCSRFSLLVGLGVFSLLVGVASTNLAFASEHDETDVYESTVVDIVERIKQGDLAKALQMTEQHLTKFPKSRTGHLLRADILQAMVSNPTVLTGQAKVQSNYTGEKAETAEGIAQQIKNRWAHHSRDLGVSHSKVPASLIDMGRHDYVMVSDMKAGRLYLYRNKQGLPELVSDYYLSVGSAGYGKEVEGDNRTPIGVYSIYQHIPGSELPDLYGKGAYPVNYPNLYDRAKQRTGYGIWLHGTPSNTYARSPLSSEGCFVLSNDDLIEIEQYIDVENRTPVVLADEIEWISTDELKVRRTQLTRAIDAWKADWESLNTSAYLKHYSKEKFNFGTEEFQPWAKRKQQVNAGKTFIQVDLQIDSLFLYPGVKDMFVVQYQQRYLSNNYVGAAQKEQYWQRDSDGQWKIVFES